MNEIIKYGMISDWVYVYKKYIPQDVLYDLSFQMTVRDNGEERVENIYLYEEYEDEGIIAIPRYCKYGKYLLDNNLLIDNRTEGTDIDINIKVNPRDDYQEEAIESVIKNDNGILCAKTAFGKTYVAINAISKLKKRALILMHKRDLMYQWKEDILKYTDLEEDDIQIFTGSKFLLNKKITITTVQNISAKIRNNEFNIRELFEKENFGITIYDECHTTVGPLVNTMTSRWIFSKRIYGLSATPKRGDELDKVIESILGDIIYKDNRRMIPVFVSFAPFNINIPNNILYYLSRSEKQYSLRYNKWLLKQSNYIKHCSSIITELIKQDKKILVVGSLKDLIKVIYNDVFLKLNTLKISSNRIKLIHGTSKDSYDSIKNMTDEEIEKFNCIFSTNKFFSEGLSLNWLDTIVYLTPPSSKSLSAIPQLVGRIVREYKGKTFVNVIDIYNAAFNIEVKRKNNRTKAYKNLNYNVLQEFSYISNYDKYIEFVLEESKKYSLYF